VHAAAAAGLWDISTSTYYIATVREPTWAYFSLFQRSKRGRHVTAQDRQYWYAALSLLLLRCPDGWDGAAEGAAASAPRHGGGGGWEVVGASFRGPDREGAVVEALLAPGRYLVLPVHTPGGRAGRAPSQPSSSSSSSSPFSAPTSSSSSAAAAAAASGGAFAVHVYSALPVAMEARTHPRAYDGPAVSYVAGHALALALHPRSTLGRGGGGGAGGGGGDEEGRRRRLASVAVGPGGRASAPAGAGAGAAAVIDLSGDDDVVVCSSSGTGVHVEAFVVRRAVFLSVVNDSPHAVTCRLRLAAGNLDLTSPFARVDAATAPAPASAPAIAAAEPASNGGWEKGSKPLSCYSLDHVALPPSSYRVVALGVAVDRRQAGSTGRGSAVDEADPAVLTLEGPADAALVWLHEVQVAGAEAVVGAGGGAVSAAAAAGFHVPLLPQFAAYPLHPVRYIGATC
jgi:hypothetical protein